MIFIGCSKEPVFTGERIYEEIVIESYERNSEKYERLEIKAQEIKMKRELKQKRLEEERKRKEREEQRKKEAWRKSSFSHVVEYTLKISYYTDANTTLEGGKYDRKGKVLSSYTEPIVAMNSSIPYGSYLITDKPVNGHTKFKIVDCGGAMKINNGVANVDVFIPGKTSRWLELNTNKQTVEGKVYYKR